MLQQNKGWGEKTYTCKDNLIPLLYSGKKNKLLQKKKKKKDKKTKEKKKGRETNKKSQGYIPSNFWKKVKTKTQEFPLWCSGNESD